ncbi:prolyl endopeptidase-like [Planococcus citri]|uniref:prolyl endopeptidase-like n=1 Tax=Planococcus citri TaxID=170843 RepID=UPI0031F8AE35
MENLNCTETKKFLEDEIAISKPYLEKSPFRAEVQARHEEVADYSITLSRIFQQGKYFFSFRNTGIQNQDVIYVSESAKDEGKIFIDPNSFSKDGSVSIDSFSISEDGLIFAYLLMNDTSGCFSMHFKHVEKGEIYKDKMENISTLNLRFVKNKGVLYTNKDRKQYKLYYHELGTEQCKDIVVAEFPDHPDYIIFCSLSDCGNYLIINPYTQGFKKSLVYLADISQGVKPNLKLIPIITTTEAQYNFIANNGNEFIFISDKDPEKKRIFSVDITNPDPKSWKDTVPENDKDTLEWAAAAYNYLVVCYTRDVKSVLQVHDIMTGEMIKTLEIDIATVSASTFFSDRKFPNAFFSVETFLSPGITYHCDFSKPSFDLEIINEIKVKNFDREKFTVEQVFYKSKDGTSVPMYIVYKKGLKKDGNNFTFLYTRGRFGGTMAPYFFPTQLVVVSNFDGIYAMPSVRGGSDYGEKWHQGGSLEKTQNSFDDFQAAAECLIAEKYTNSKLLAIYATGNGGLITGACLNQRPDLFGAVICDLGTFDMLRYDQFTDGKDLVVEYGAPSDPKFFPILYKYSPLQNIKIPEGGDKQYPATMVLTKPTDNESPKHGLKFIATLQYEAKNHTNQKNPFIIQVLPDTSAASTTKILLCICTCEAERFYNF